MTSSKNILPLLSANLAAPFATAYAPLLQASVKALEAAILNDWPRISHHRGEILKGLTICWCRILEQETESKELNMVQESIKRMIQLLTAVMKTDVNVIEEYQILIDSDDRLRGLLKV